MEDYIILVDEKKNILGTAPKLQAHNNNTPLHLAFSIFLFNSKGEFLLQQRSREKKTWPLIWSNSCCGHQKLNTNLIDTAAQRLAYEMGITDATLQVLLSDFRYRCEMNGIWENEICPVLVGITNQEPIINKDEVEAYQWMQWSEWLSGMGKKSEKYSYWCVKETKALLKELKFKQFLSSLQ